MTTHNLSPEDSDSTKEPGQCTDAAAVAEAMLARMYEEEAERLLNFLSRRLDRSEAETLHNQVWLQFFLWWPAHPEHPNPKGTLYRVAHKRVIDHQRRAGREKPVEDGQLEALAMELHGVKDGFAAVELRLDLKQALTDLNERERWAVQLRHIDGLSVGACAALMGQTSNNMKKILKVALQKLRKSPRMGAYKAVEEMEK